MIEHKIKTKAGTFLLRTTQQGIYSLNFPGKKKFASRHPERSPASRGEVEGSRSGSLDSLRSLGMTIADYLNGKKRYFSKLKIDYSGRTLFEKKVLRALSQVPPGKVVSYGELARGAGFPGAARAVGSVMRKNRLPIILPCHRVLRAGGSLGNYSQGLSWKKRLLALEAGRR